MSLAGPHRISRRLAGVLLGLAALCVTLGLAPRACASPALDAGNRAFAEGRYGEAAAQYEALLARRGYSAPVLFDLGNAYLRAERPVDAILAYERARVLSPRDAAIAGNLAAARKAAGLSEERGLADLFEHLLSANEWTWLATGAVWLAVTAGAGAFLFRRRRGWLVGAASLGALVASVAGGTLAVSSGELRTGLVVRATPALVSPFASAQSGFSLGAGTAVELGRVHDGYMLIRDRSGQSGWVELTAVAPLIPD